MREFTVEEFPNIGAIMASKLVTEKGYKPNFIFREKPFNENDSGWRIFSSLEDDEYSDNPDNFGFYAPSSILKIDDSISQILLYKGIGSVWERHGADSEWEEVTDYPLDDDYIVEEKLSKNWSFSINNLFLRQLEDNDLMFTTNDKTVRFSLWTHEAKVKEEIFAEKEKEILDRQAEINPIKIYKFEEGNILKIGYHIKEYDEYKDYEYNMLCAFSIIDNEEMMNFFYFDEDKDLDWALETWKSINQAD